MDPINADYLVIGAGATGMAFTDALIADSESTVVLADRRDAPGGHWNDAYPFVRLQPDFDSSWAHRARLEPENRLNKPSSVLVGSKNVGTRQDS